MAVRQGKRQILRAAIGRGSQLERLEDRTLLSTINWTNKGTAGDNFSIFGANADRARAVVQQALNDWQAVIADFHNGSNTLNLSVSMSNNAGFGASAGGNTESGGQPTGGNITINSGSNGNGSGFFLDPTPGDDSEFRGNIINAYSADATPGGIADGKYDLYTIVALETAHILGLNDWTGEKFAADAHGYLTNTATQDAAVGAGKGILWTYNGPDVQALFTSDNAWTESRDHALHTAEPRGGNLITSGGISYYGAQDSDNAFFEQSRRYLPSNLDTLVLKDSYGYTINTPSRNMYATFDSTTGNVMLRGGQTGQTTYTSSHAQSDDTINVDTSTITFPFPLNLVSTSVHIGNWVEGTGPAITLTNAWLQGSVNSITIDSGAGSDTVNVRRVPAGVPVTVTTGAAGTVTVGNDASGLSEVLGPVNIQNSSAGGETTLNLNDSGNAAAVTANVTVFTPSGDTPWGRISGLAPADITFRNNDIASLDIATGSGADAVNFKQLGDSFGADQFTTLLSAGGAGTAVNVGDGSVQNIYGTLLLSNPLHFNTVRVSDNSDRTGRVMTIQKIAQSSDPGNDPYDTILGLGPGTIAYDINDTTSATITLGVGGNTVNVRNVDVPTTITGGGVLPIILGTTSDAPTYNLIIPPILIGGDNTINVGTGSSVQTVVADLTVENPYGTNTINVNDGSNTAARTAAFDTTTGVAADAAPFGVISGLAPGNINYEFGDTGQLNVTLGVGGNTVNVHTIGVPTNLFGGSVPIVLPFGAGTTDIIPIPPLSRGGPNTINIGQNASVQSIAAPLTIENRWDFNTININDAYDTIARTVTLDTIAATNDSAPYGAITGLAPAVISYEYDDTSSMNVTLGVGGNTVNVHSTGAPINFDGGSVPDILIPPVPITQLAPSEVILPPPRHGGPDTFNITSAGSAQDIAGALGIRNGWGPNTIIIDDSADVTPRTVTLSGFAPGGGVAWQRVSGLAPADITYVGDDVSTTNHVTIDGGSGGNTINVTGVAAFHANTGGIDLNTGAGDDIITVTGTAPGMVFNVNGQDGNDALTVDFSAGNIAGGMSIAFNGGAGVDNLTVSGQSPGTPITVNAGHIVDGTSNVNYTGSVESLTLDPATFSVLDDLSGITLSTLDAGTIVNINVTQHLAALNVGNFTTVKLAAGALPGGITVFTNSLSVGALAARLDLTNNALQVNYGAGTNPVLAVRNQIGTAYAGGAWSGPGITTSKGDATHALGYGDSADGIVSGLPADSVLIKFTLAGDLNLDGHVNFNDLLSLAQHYGQTGTHWDQGDLNYDGSVSFTDLLKLAQNYNGALSAAAQPLAAAAAPPAGLSITPAKRRRH